MLSINCCIALSYQTDEKRFSRGSELDNVSALSTTTYKTLGPVKTSSRIGQFLRKIGASKPPISAASLISLNKVNTLSAATNAYEKHFLGRYKVKSCLCPNCLLLKL